MGVAGMLARWTRAVQGVLAGLHGHQSKALAVLSLGMVLAEHCQLTKAAVGVAVDARIDSVRRRFERLVANPRLDPLAAQGDLAAAALAAWAGRRVNLLLDETPLGEHLRAMKLCLRHRRRALPLAWRCYRPDEPPGGQAAVVAALLAQVAPRVPPGAAVTLLADRGLAWPSLIDACRRLGWRFVLRVQGSTRVRLAGGPERAMAELAPRPGAAAYGPALAFKKAGWRAVNVAAFWPPGSKVPWLLVTDWPAEARRFAHYRGRMSVEEAFKDEKSGGFRWGDSRVRDPAHAARLLLALALATWLALALGSRVIKRGWRRLVDRPLRGRVYSLFRLGLRHLRWMLARGRPPDPTLRLYPTEPIAECVG